MARLTKAQVLGKIGKMFPGKQAQVIAEVVEAIGPTGAAVTDSTATNATAAPAGGTGAAAGGWDTAGNRDTAITSMNATRTLALELQTKLNALLAALRANGTIS